MLKSYLKVALRYLARHKGYTFINVLGLAVGITCCLLIMLFVKSEWSFDRFHTKSDRLHRAWLQEFYEGQVFTNTVTPVPLAPVLQAGLPEVEATARVYAFNTLVKYGANTFNEPVNMVDSSFFNLFDFELIAGSRQHPFPNGQALIVSQAAAKKYFGSGQAVGKVLQLQLGEDKVLFTVTGVTRDVPLESSIRFDLLIPFSNAPRFFSENTITKAWSNVTVETYVLLRRGAPVAAADKKIAQLMQPLVAKNYKPGEYNVRLQPMTDIHLNNSLPAGNEPVSDPKYSFILATVGLLILLIACINFVTLSIGRSATRALEVGVRKVLGAERRQLVRQFWGEALLLTLFAVVIGWLMALLLLKPFNVLVNRELSLVPTGFSLLFSFVLVVVIGLVAGMYPAFVLSGFRPVQVLKGRVTGGSRMGFFRRSLVVAQFVASIIMIIGTISISRQLAYLQSKHLGYNREEVVVVPTNKRRAEGYPLALRFRSALAGNPQVVGSTTSLFSMAEGGWMQLGYNDDKDVFRQFRFNAVDVEFIPAMGLQLIAGRNFRADNPADSNSILVNEALVKEYGWKHPIGQKLPGKYGERVIGVVKDFHFESLHTPIQPLVMALKADSIFSASSDVSFEFPPQPRVSVRLRAGNVRAQVAALQSAWKSVAGGQDFEFRFLDEALNTAYQQEHRLCNMVRYASALSIFIACMGLFGLATLTVVRRTKEIGIRKVLGADTRTIVALLSRDFVWMVLLASLIAFPVAWWALNKWMEDFAYRINLPLWTFVVAALAALLVALATVSMQAVKAARTNPVKNLRTE